MPNKNYVRGRRFEYELAKRAKEANWKVIRASGSHGEFDIVIWKDGKVVFTQCKVVKTLAEANRLVDRFLGQPRNFDNPQILEGIVVKVHRGDEICEYR